MAQMNLLQKEFTNAARLLETALQRVPGWVDALKARFARAPPASCDRPLARSPGLPAASAARVSPPSGPPAPSLMRRAAPAQTARAQGSVGGCRSAEGARMTGALAGKGVVG